MSPPGRIFLTGATGFIGSRLADALAKRGYALLCLVRASSKTAALRKLGAELVEGDVTDATFLAQVMRGTRAAFHLAAFYDMGIVDAREMERINVGGTRAFLSAVEQAGVPRAIYVSTTAALGPVAHGIGDENSEYNGPFPSAYHRTKTEAHRLAREAQARGLPLIIVCPANVYGPGDDGPNGRFVRDLVHGRVPGLLGDPGWYSYVHVDDVAQGLVLALERGTPGATYVLSADNASVNEFAERVCRAAGRKAPRLRLPRGLALALASVCDAIARPTGLRFPMARETIAASTTLRWLHSHERATRELGWTPRSLDEGLPETVESYRRAGPR